uniref:Disease resistance protein RPM1-like n=1 Tax=Populus alba TaxID=43335 RepID=A0A4U5MB44_POPAL|nr:disease resistance protein RPM1-like [Populus alba]
MRNVCGLHFLLVLDLDGRIERLPDELGDLIHLRYLGLVGSELDELPGTLGNLKRLQTLDIRWCRQLRKLPIQILHIQQLRHLLMSDIFYGGEIRVPKGIGTLVNLHTLSGIYGGDDISMELTALSVKRVSADHASELFAAIKKMENLTSLSLVTETNYFEDTPFSIFPELDAFSPPTYLVCLHGKPHPPIIKRFLSIRESDFSPSVSSQIEASSTLGSLQGKAHWVAEHFHTSRSAFLPDLKRQLMGEENYKIKHVRVFGDLGRFENR